MRSLATFMLLCMNNFSVKFPTLPLSRPLLSVIHDFLIFLQIFLLLWVDCFQGVCFIHRIIRCWIASQQDLIVIYLPVHYSGLSGSAIYRIFMITFSYQFLKHLHCIAFLCRFATFRVQHQQVMCSLESMKRRVCEFDVMSCCRFRVWVDFSVGICEWLCCCILWREY